MNESRSQRYRLQVGGALFAVLLFQLIFGSSYIGAFHNPRAEGIPLGVAAPTPALASKLKQLVEKNAGTSFSVRIVDEANSNLVMSSLPETTNQCCIGVSLPAWKASPRQRSYAISANRPK